MIKVNSFHEGVKNLIEMKTNEDKGVRRGKEDPEKIVNAMLRGVWVLSEQVKNIGEENDASMKKHKEAKCVGDAGRKSRESKIIESKARSFLLEGRVININKC